MPLFEIETNAHIIITWAADDSAAEVVVQEKYPQDQVIRLTKRPRDTWVISKAALGLTRASFDPCATAGIAWKKLPATKSTPFGSTCMRPARTWNMRKVIESNMVMGW